MGSVFSGVRNILYFDLGGEFMGAKILTKIHASIHLTSMYIIIGVQYTYKTII
jgi:hypothetical protein